MYISILFPVFSAKCGKEARLAATSSNYTVRLYSRSNIAYIDSIKGNYTNSQVTVALAYMVQVLLKVKSQFLYIYPTLLV